MATNCYPIVTDIVGNKSWITHRETDTITIDDFEMLADELIWAFKTKNTETKLVKQSIILEKKLITP
jgi:hypothetical protein